ncbi:uncharacterized protein LOC119101410 [Pollicipes pollicipes]|uniref:uncharacterized protein LOC119101410 n=1 Tax=Pollicipes pollicipes TaxID=41117 RepID=UPI0018856531|nr:uncharacterized protein LOC119101410 [Pollicipes pollicipes]
MCDSSSFLSAMRPGARLLVTLLLCSGTRRSTAKRKAFYCFQCTGESTDPDDHCTDSGWVSIPRGRRLDYKFLCPEQLSFFCMKTVEVWESDQPGVPNKYRTRRGCSGSTRFSQQEGTEEDAGATRFTVTNGCTDFVENPSTGG